MYKYKIQINCLDGLEWRQMGAAKLNRVTWCDLSLIFFLSECGLEILIDFNHNTQNTQTCTPIDSYQWS